VPTVAEIVIALAEKTQAKDAASWDPIGLQIGDPAAEVSAVGVCHEVTEEVVAEIAARPVDLLVTYHPLIFDPLTKLVAGRSPGARARRLIETGTAVLVTHTDFDAAPGGAADSLAGALDLTELAAFGNEETDDPPIGRVGRFDGSLADLSALVALRLGASRLRVSGDSDRSVDRVAVVPGSGSDFIAAAAGTADALVTGDVSHHRSIEALDWGLTVVDPGHIATERPGVRALLELVTTTLEVAVVDLTHLDPATWS
jgi:dinuclear metal center YbgI/SA1388 family protein